MARQGGELRLNLIGFLLILSRWKWFLYLHTIVWCVAAVAIALLLPQTFQAKTILMPPKGGDGGGLSRIMKNLPMSGLAGGSADFFPSSAGKDMENIYLAILGSRTLQMAVIDSFHLAHVYKFDKAKKYYFEDVIKKFNEDIGIEVTKEGTFALYMEDESPQRAADIVNFMAQKLNEIYKTLTVETERNQRLFLEERLILIKADLDSAERRYVKFQKDNKMLDIDEQARATIEAGSNMEARYLAAELKLDIDRKVFSAENPKVREQAMELQELRKQRDDLLRVRKSDLLIPYKQAPEMALQLVRLKRDLKIQEILFELMQQQYEHSKMEEAKNTPTVQVLDRAIPPQKRSSPKRGKMCIIAFLISIGVGIGIVSLVEYFRRFKVERAEEYAGLRKIWKNLWGWKPAPD